MGGRARGRVRERERGREGGRMGGGGRERENERKWVGEREGGWERQRGRETRTEKERVTLFSCLHTHLKGRACCYLIMHTSLPAARTMLCSCNYIYLAEKARRRCGNLIVFIV